jgi:hypothetical protein
LLPPSNGVGPALVIAMPMALPPAIVLTITELAPSGVARMPSASSMMRRATDTASVSPARKFTG